MTLRYGSLVRIQPASTKFFKHKKQNSAVAQLVRALDYEVMQLSFWSSTIYFKWDQEVAGSNPACAANFRSNVTYFFGSTPTIVVI